MDRLWLRHYPPGVPSEIDAVRYPSLVAMFEESFTKYADREACACMGKSLTYADLEKTSRALAAWLQNLGLKRGARVAIMMPNVLQYPIAIAAILRAGCTVVNVNPLYKPRELEFQLSDAGAEAIIVLENFAGILQQALPNLQVRHVVIASLGDMLGAVKGTIVNGVVRYIKKMVPAYTIPGATKFNDAVEAGRTMALEASTLTPDDIAFLQYTGGTTGVAKGAMLLHRNLVANMLQVEAWNQPMVDIPPKLDHMIIVTALPLYHIFALTACFLLGMRLGGMCLLIPNPRDIPGLIKELSHYKVNIFPAVNTLYNALLHHPNFGKIDWSMLKCTIGGGMAVQKPVADAWVKATGRPIIEGYGLSETSPVLRATAATSVNGPEPSDFRCPRLKSRSATRTGMSCRSASRARSALAVRRSWRATGSGPRDHKSNDKGRIFPHRRHRRDGRAGPCAHRRPQEGHDLGVGLQGIPERGRGSGHEPWRVARMRRRRRAR